MSESTPLANGSRSFLGWSARVIAVLTLVYLSATGVEWATVWKHITQVPLSSILGLIGLYALVHAARTLRFYLLLRDIPFSKVWDISAKHTLFLRILPFRSGELAYAVLLKRAGIQTTGVGLAHLAVTRFLDIAVVALLCLAGLTFHAGPFPDELFIPGALVMLGTFGIGVAYLKSLFGIARRALSFLPSSGLLGKLKTQGDSLLLDAETAVSDIQPKEFWITVSVSFLVWVTAFGVMGIAIGAGEQEIPVGAVLIGGSVTILASFIPLGILGSFGILEAGWMFGFRSVGVHVDQAVAGALLYTSLTLLCAIFLALPGFLRKKPAVVLDV